MNTDNRSARRLLVSGALAVGVVVLDACGNDGPSSAADPETPDIALIGTNELTFEPGTLEISAGDDITIGLTSEAGVKHDVVVADAADVGTVGGADEKDVEDGDLYVVGAGAGKSTNATLTIDEPGTYEIYCSVPGHREAGMTATLTVTDAG